MTKKRTKPAAQRPVSAGNPCPVLRALVADGTLSDSVESVSHIAKSIVAVAKKGDGAPDLPPVVIHAMAMTANGLSALPVLGSKLKGVQSNALRDGPLDKKGVGSGILRASGEVDITERARLKTFASQETSSSGTTELGLSLDEITSFMDANFARAEGRRWRALSESGRRGAAGG